jgi:hypothetical protein
MVNGGGGKARLGWREERDGADGWHPHVREWGENATNLEDAN